jgi:tetratricopeptide (TPR) repeat protein
LHGELEAARAELDLALSEARAGEHRAFIVVAPAHAELLLQLGDADSALREVESILEHVRALSLDGSAEVAAERIRALCENALGRSEAARASIERAFARAAELGFGGLPLAQLHEARARILLDMGEAEQYREDLGELHRAIEHAEAPALVTAYEALREESSRKLSLSDLPAFVSVTRSMGDSSTIMGDVITRLSAATGPAKRARQALELLLEDSGARSGCLFLCGQAGLFVAAAVDETDAEEVLLPIARHYLDGELGETKTETINVSELTSGGTTLPTLLTESGSPYLPVLLADRRDLHATLVGVALIAVAELSPRTPRVDLVRAVSHGLRTVADGIGRTTQ